MSIYERMHVFVLGAFPGAAAWRIRAALGRASGRLLSQTFTRGGGAGLSRIRAKLTKLVE
jgi:hypothetical protein